MNALSSINVLLAAEAMEPRIFQLDAQLLHDTILLMIAVFVLFLFLSYMLFNPVRKLLSDRKEKIKNELETAKADMEKANELKAQYDAKLKDIEKEANEILSEARKKALANENRIIADAKAEAARIIERANTEGELQKQKIADEVKTEMISIASIIAGKVVATSINTTIQAALVNETLKELGESTWLS